MIKIINKNLYRKIAYTNNGMKKIKQKEFLIMLSISVFVTLLILLISSTFSYFKSNKTILGQIQLGELDFSIETSKINDIIMPGDTIDLTVSVLNKVEGKERLIPFYFRFKTSDNDNYQLNVDLNNFILGEDGFYYCKYKVEPYKSQLLFTNINIDKNVTAEQTIEFGILVEAVQSEYQAYLDIFDSAPPDWIDFIENN